MKTEFIGNFSEAKQKEAEEDIEIIEETFYTNSYQAYGTKENPIKIAVRQQNSNQKVNWRIWSRKTCIYLQFDIRV
jgi:hypothetical protein